MSSSSTDSIRWRGGGGGGNVLAQRFPSFQFDAEDVLNGKVKVFARSPSGRMQPMDVLDADGLFNANFTPDEVGDWTVSILYEGRNIEGSPFNVRVHDPGQIRVIGLDGSLASRNYTFSVDASRAGQGPLIIDITYNGQLIPAHIAQDPHRDKQFNVKFKPRGAGYYTVRIFFSDVEITGSPFTVEVVDSGTVIASGEGLVSAQAHHQAVFTVSSANDTGFNAGECRVAVFEPRGMQIASNVMNQHDGSLRVEFVPVVVGEHKIDIKYCGRPITGSPFICKVSDCAQITVTNLCNVARCGKPIEFDVNTVRAGHGDLEITVNGGTVPCTVQPIGNRRFHASFTPRLAVPHDVEVTFNGQEVAGSPWRVDVMNPAQVTVVGAGSQLLPVCVPACFEIHGAVGCADGDLVVNITSPCKKMVRCTMTCIGNGVYRVEYTPIEVGEYCIEVIYDCMAVPCSPFTSKAYDASAIRCCPVPLGFVDKPVEFNVDVSRAGEGQLEITVDYGGVPNTARPIDKGQFAVTFTPRDARPHVVQITFNGEQCSKCGTVTIPVIDICQVSVQPPARSVPVNCPALTRVVTAAAGEAELVVNIKSPVGSTCPCRVSGTGGKGYDVEFTPKISGEYEMEFTYGGVSVPGGPFNVHAYDLNRIKVSDLCDGVVGQETSFKIDTNAAGNGNLEVTVTNPAGATLYNYVRPLVPGVFGVFFSPTHCGMHLVNVSFNGELICGSPFHVNVIDPSKASARGDGLDMVQCNQVTSFFVSAPAAHLKDFDIKIIGPGSKDVMFRVNDSGSNTYKVDYTPVVPGEYSIEVKYFGQPVAGSPFTAKAWDTNKVTVSNVIAGRVGLQSSFNINVRDAGEGTLEISISGPSGQNISNSVTTLGPGHFLVSYIPLEAGQHRANVTFNGESVAGNPFTFVVNDPSRVTARGDGLSLVQCGQQASFTINAPGAQLRDIDVRVTCPKGKDVPTRCSEAGTNTFKCTYTPPIAGDYKVEICCFDQPILNSPFTAHASDISKVVVSSVTTGIVGQPSCFTIDVKNAGDGTLEISICGPSGQNLSNNVTAQGPGLFLVNYVPVESGQHRASVTFNKENIRGNPFMFMVIDPLKVSVRGDGLGLIKANQSTSFVITAPAADLSDLDVTVTDPSGKQLLSRICEIGNHCFKVDYIPICPGDYQIDVCYFGQSVPSSPFCAKVWDASKVVVAPIASARVCVQSTFCIDVRGAGEGTLEIGICGPSGQNIPNNVVSLGPSQFEVMFVPTESGQHRTNITFNKENVNGTPFQFLVTDLNKATARGDGLGQVRVGSCTAFYITAPAAQCKDIDINICGPGGRMIVPKITDQGNGNFKVEYTPTAAGDYKIEVSYFDCPLTCSPFLVKAWDVSKVCISEVRTGHVSAPCSFKIDSTEAGEGCVDITVTGPNGTTVPHTVTSMGPTTVNVAFVPNQCGVHYACVAFNKENVPGSKVSFMVIDPLRFTAQGDGLGLVRVGQTASFNVCAPCAQIEDLAVCITGPEGKRFIAKIKECGAQGEFIVEYMPTLVGDYEITFTYFGEPITTVCCVAKAWDPCAIKITGIKAGTISKPTTFVVNLTGAGKGCLDVSIMTGCDTIPHTIKEVGNCVYCITFIPQSAETHTAIVKFNSEMVKGSPFEIPIIDGRKATASGECLGGVVIANKPCSFDINTKMVNGSAPLCVTITSPRNQQVNARVSETAFGFHVEFTPCEAGRYMIDIKFAEMEICGNPFCVDVFDPSQVRVGRMPQGILGKCFMFEVDLTMSGPGRVAVDVRGEVTRPLVEVAERCEGLLTVSFVPQECCLHTVVITMNGSPVPGSPFKSSVVDVGSLCVNWDAIRLRPVHCPVVVSLDAKGSPEADIACTVTGPAGQHVQPRITRSGHVYKAEFVGHVVGGYCVELAYGGVAVPGSPFTCQLYDISKVKVTESAISASISQPVSFAVDASEAGIGDLDIDVLCKDTRIATQSQPLGRCHNRYTFIPMSPHNHIINIKFNFEDIPGSPMIVRVINPASQMSISGVGPDAPVCVGQPVVAIVNTQGISCNPADVNASAKAPGGELLMVRVLPDHDNCVRVEYTSRFTGCHHLEVQYAGQMINGCPFITEFFDPSKVLIEGCRTGRVGDQMSLDVTTLGAGMADLKLHITNDRGMSVPSNVHQTAQGYQVTYVPADPGTHSIHVTYGGIAVPGCPVSQEIEDNFLPTASGDGLQCGVENVASTFEVQSVGQQGDLSVNIVGPNTMCRCNIERLQDGRRKVTYVPVEVGTFTITITWNGREIPGSPFKANVINPDRVAPIGGWLGLFNGQSIVKAYVYKLQMVEFETCQAGSGELSATVTAPDRSEVPTKVARHDTLYDVSFMPTITGDYMMKVFWGGKPLKRCPIVFCIMEEEKCECEVQELEKKICPEKVVVVGPGLTDAFCNEEAEFIIDGSNAGPGEPQVKLIGVQEDVCVRCVLVGECRYRCCYTADRQGAYLLSISWASYQIPGSPFKVSVGCSNDASKVTVTGQGLEGGPVGQDLCLVVDTRRAGSGELLATCRGQMKPALCELVDQQDGRFLLRIRPQEPGCHQLSVTFCGEPILGSPFNIKVTCGADASKVRVSGPGLQPGLLLTFQSDLLVETRGAGPGRLTVRVRGPKGAFRVEMSKDESRDRAIRCRYNPTEVGQYVLHIQWSGVHVPGSPFTVPIVDTRRELDMLGASSLSGPGEFQIPSSFSDSPLIIDAACPDFNGTLRMSTLSGDGLIFTDDA